MKKVLVVFMGLGLLLVVGALLLTHMNNKDKSDMAPLPDNPEQNAIIGTWVTTSDSENDMTFTFKADGSITGEVEGSNFKGSWGEEDTYVIYNADDKSVFNGSIENGVLELKSSDFVSSASKWKLTKE